MVKQSGSKVNYLKDFFDYGFLARRNKYIHNESGNKSKYNLIIFQAGQNRTYIQKQFSA